MSWSMRVRRWACVSIAIAAGLAVAGCSSGSSPLRCSFNDPAELDESADGWPKFRRDGQNTGTIVLAASAYARLAAQGAAPLARSAAWTYPAVDEAREAAFTASPVLSPDGDRLYIGATSGRLFALQTRGADLGRPVVFESGGLPRDFLTTAEPFAMTAAALAARREEGEALFVGAGNARVFGLTGDGFALPRIWPIAADTFIATPLALGIDGTVYGGTLGNGFFAICPNGVVRFALSSGPTLAAPAVGRDAVDERRDGTIYFGSDDGLLRAVFGDGVIAWTFALPAPILAAPVVLLDEAPEPSTTAIFAVDATGRLVRLTPAGRLAPGFVPPDGLGRVLASPALAAEVDGAARLYVASKDTGLHAIDATTGDILWSFAVGTGIESSPAVVLDDSGESAPVIVFGGDDGVLYFVRDDGSEAELLGTFTTPAALPIVSSPAIGADGTVYFGGLDGRVYAID